MNESLVHKFLCLIVNNHSHETFLWILKQAIDKCISELITVKSENSSNRVVCITYVADKNAKFFT